MNCTRYIYTTAFGVVGVIGMICMISIPSGENPRKKPLQHTYCPYNGTWVASNSHPRLASNCNVISQNVYPQAERCLAGRHIIFVGDSLTRYQYLSLVFFLENKVWLPGYGNDSFGYRSPCLETQWPSWRDFYLGTTAQLNGHESCDCCRANNCTVLENRYYRKKPFSITYLQFFRHDMGMSGHVGFPPSNSSPPCRPGDCNAHVDWKGDLAHAMQTVVSRLKPDYIVLNSGLWQSTNGWSTQVISQVIKKINDVLKPKNGTAIWKTTTQSRSMDISPNHDSKIKTMAAQAGWKIFDAWALTRALPLLKPSVYWDNLHFLPFVYNELNTALLHNLCAWQWSDNS